MASYDEALQKMYSDRLTRFYRNYDEAKVASVPTLLQKYKGKEEQLLAAMVKKYGPEPEPEDDAADAAATDEEDDEHPRVAPGKNADGADDDEELAQPAPEEPFVRGVRSCSSTRRGDGVLLRSRGDGVGIRHRRDSLLAARRWREAGPASRRRRPGWLG